MVAVFTYVSILLSILVVLYTTPKWIRSAKRMGFAGIDKNKKSNGDVAEAGGLPVVLGFIVGFLFYVGSQVFFYGVDSDKIIFSFAAATAILLAALIGFVDDVLGWKIGISQNYKVILTLFIPLPVMVLNAGEAIMEFPFIGMFDFGIFFPLVIVPLIIIGATNGFNMLAGYNGLEGGMGVIILSSLGLLSFFVGDHYVSALCLTMTVALLAFLKFNWFPAKIFPGDTLTYAVGAMIGLVTILGNLEKFAFFLFIPYFIEFVLKARGKFKKESWAKVKKNGLENLYDKWYSVPHIFISFWNRVKGSVTERQVVISIYTFELIFVAVAFLSYFRILPI